MVAVPRGDHGDIQVAVVPAPIPLLTTPTTSIVIPRTVNVALGLNPQPSWVRMDELNVFAWPSYDLRAVPGTNRIDYGPLPQPFFERVRRRIVELDRVRRIKRINRD